MMDKELLLYRYFSNELTETNRKDFEALLKTDAEFKAQFEFEKDLKQAIGDKQNQTLKSKLQGFERAIPKEVKTPKAGWDFRKWSMAASIALLVGLGWLGYTTMSGTGYEDLYNSNFDVYPNTVYTITRGNSKQSLERDAFAAYEMEDFEKAAALFMELKTQGGTDHDDFYLAQTNLNLGNLKEAIQGFETVLAEDPTFKAEANWYLALAYLKKEDKANAVATLKKQIAAFDFNKERATELLKELD